MPNEPTGDERALRAAIQANPRDDTPRLVYADWLDDHEQHEKAARMRLLVQRRQLRTQAWADRVAPDTSFGIDFEAISLPLARVPLGAVLKASDGSVDEHIRDLIGAERDYFRACLGACFGRRGMAMWPPSSFATLWEAAQQESPPQTVGQFVRECRAELIRAYLNSRLVSGRDEAVAFANEVMAAAQAVAKDIISGRSAESIRR